MQQLTALDQLFLALESDTTYGHVGSLAILDPSSTPSGGLTLDELKRCFEDRIHLLAPMRMKLAEVPFGLDRPYWVVDEDFDLDFHLREIALPAPGSDEQLSAQVARIFSRHLDRARPLWECYLIQGLPDGRVGIMTKVHHSAVDGMSGAEIMGILYDLSPDGREIEPPSTDLVAADGAPSGLGMLARGLVGLPRGPLRAVQRLPTVLPHVDVAPSVLGLPGARTVSRTLSRARNLATGQLRDGHVVERPRMRAPRAPFSGRISAHRKFAFADLSLTDVKRVKDHFGVKVNDVVVALVAGAVRDWLVEHDALPDRPLLAQVPVSVRTDEQRGTFGNRISVMIVEIPTDEDDPAGRIDRAHACLRSAKERHGAMPAELLQDATAFIPPAVHARAMRVALQLSAQKQVRPLYNLVISNVPGPPIPIFMAGAKLERFFPISVITDGAGLNVTVMSYLDRLGVGIVACPQQMPDADRLIEAMREDLAALVALCDAPAPAG